MLLHLAAIDETEVTREAQASLDYLRGVGCSGAIVASTADSAGISAGSEESSARKLHSTARHLELTATGSPAENLRKDEVRFALPSSSRLCHVGCPYQRSLAASYFQWMSEIRRK